MKNIVIVTVIIVLLVLMVSLARACKKLTGVCSFEVGELVTICSKKRLLCFTDYPSIILKKYSYFEHSENYGCVYEVKIYAKDPDTEAQIYLYYGEDLHREGTP